MKDKAKITSNHDEVMSVLYDKWLDIFRAFRKAYEYGAVTDWKETVKLCVEGIKKDALEKTGNKIDLSKYKSDLDALSDIQSNVPQKSVAFLKDNLFMSQNFYGFKNEENILTDELHIKNLILEWEKNFKKEQSVKQRQEGDKVSEINKEFGYITSLVKDPEILDKMLTDKKSLKDTLLGDPRAAYIINENPDIEEVVDAFSETIDYSLSSGKIRNPHLGEFSKSRADEFAESMTNALAEVKAEGHTSTRAIADAFNEKNITSLRGGKWSHNTVARLLNRRKDLGLDSSKEGESLTAE